MKAPHGARVMEIQWADGHKAILPHEILRGYCPCAHCQGHGGALKFVPGGDLDLRDIQRGRQLRAPVHLGRPARLGHLHASATCARSASATRASPPSTRSAPPELHPRIGRGPRLLRRPRPRAGRIRTASSPPTFLAGAGPGVVAAAAHQRRDRVRGAVERRQVEPHQHARRAQEPRAHQLDAGLDAPDQPLRGARRRRHRPSTSSICRATASPDAARPSRASWAALIEGYLGNAIDARRGRPPRRRARGLEDDDRELLAFIDAAKPPSRRPVEVILVATKLDKEPRSARKTALRPARRRRGARACSASPSVTGEGRDELWRALRRAALGEAQRGAPGTKGDPRPPRRAITKVDHRSARSRLITSGSARGPARAAQNG